MPSGPAGLLAAFREQAVLRHLNAAGGGIAEGLRERKKRITRQLISDTATAMFLEKGFEEVRVADVASACNVSEKTVYNYFPTKESLLFDRFEDMEAQVRVALGPGAAPISPVEAAVAMIAADLRRTFDGWDDADQPFDPTMIRRFSELVDHTPALRAALREMMERMVGVASEAMAARAGVNPDDPEPQIAARSLLGLWHVQASSLRRHLDDAATAMAHLRAADPVLPIERGFGFFQRSRMNPYASHAPALSPVASRAWPSQRCLRILSTGVAPTV